MKLKHDCICHAKKVALTFCWPSSTKNMHTTPPHTRNAFIMTCPKSVGSPHTRDNQWFNFKDSNSKSNELSSLVIPIPHPLNNSVINPPQMSSVRQQSSSSSQNTTPESQDSLIPGRTSDDLSNTIQTLSTKNWSHNIYGFIVDLYKLTPAQLQKHAIMLLQHYRKLCSTNDPSSMFVSPPPIPNI